MSLQFMLLTDKLVIRIYKQKHLRASQNSNTNFTIAKQNVNRKQRNCVIIISPFSTIFLIFFESVKDSLPIQWFHCSYEWICKWTQNSKFVTGINRRRTMCFWNSLLHGSGHVKLFFF